MFRMEESGTRLCVFLLIFGLLDRSKSQTNGAPENISCIESEKTRICYEAFHNPVTWSAAWIECATIGGQLAILNERNISSDIGEFVDRTTAKNEDDYPMWVAGHELNSPGWQWIGGKNFSSGSVPPKTVVNLTNSVRPFDTCATVSSSASTLVFQSVQCRGSASFICQSAYNPSTPASTTCQIGPYDGVVRGNSCYAPAVSTAPMRSWFSARYECASHGADLAVFDESTDRDFIGALLASRGQTAFWVGLRRYPWVWAESHDEVTGEIDKWQEMTFSQWGSSSPNFYQRSCMAVNGKGGMGHEWTNLRCNETLPYICQLTTPLTSASPSNMNATSVGASDDSNRAKIVRIVVPIAVVGGILIIIGVSTFCYFSKRRGYVQH